MSGADISRAELARHVAAEAAGVALLLSGPTGHELWPGPDAAQPPVCFGTPQRSGLGFVVDIIAEGRAVRGRLRIEPARGDVVGTDVHLVLVASGPMPADVAGDAARFLDNLAVVAQERASAA